MVLIVSTQVSTQVLYCTHFLIEKKKNVKLSVVKSPG